MIDRQRRLEFGIGRAPGSRSAGFGELATLGHADALAVQAGQHAQICNAHALGDARLADASAAGGPFVAVGPGGRSVIDAFSSDTSA